MAKYRLSIDSQQVRIVPDRKSPDFPRHGSERIWQSEAIIEGDEVLVAAALRAYADKLDPPKPHKPTLRGES